MSLVKSNALQIGQSLTATNNFVWYQPAVADGTIRLANGNFESPTDLLTINSNGNATFVGSVIAAGTSTSSADLKLYEDTDNGTNYVSLKAPESIAANITWTLPSADGTSGQLLTTNGSGNLSWSSVTLPAFPTGTIVGTTDIQTLTGKTIAFADNTLTGVASTSTTQTLTAKTITTVASFETRVAMPANDINLATGNVFTKTISGATTLTVSNVPSAGTTAGFNLELTNGGSAAITWWSGVKWAAGTAPTLTASGRDILGFYTHDAGTTWNGLVLAKDIK